MTESSPLGISALYIEAHRSMASFLRGLDAADWNVEVMCTPGWTVRDVLSHVAGVTDDIANGRVDGAASDPWTASQVERWKTAPIDDMLATWEAQIVDVAALIEAIGEIRPAIDCHTHEHDLRQALGRPGNRDSVVINAAAARFKHAPVGRPLRIEFADRDAFEQSGEGEMITVSGITAFELVRSRLGRRSRQQVLAYTWSEPPTDDVLDHWFAFGPSDIDIVE